MQAEIHRPWVAVAVTAAIAFLLLSSLYFRNVAAFFAALFSFVPLILFYLQYGPRIYLAGGAVLSIAFFLLLGPGEGVVLSLTYLVSSALMGEMIRRNRPVEQAVFPAVFPPLISGFGLWFYQAWREKAEPIGYFHGLILNNLNETVNYYEKLGWDKEKIALLKSSLPDMATVMLSIFPGMFICSMILTLFLNYLLVRMVLARKGSPAPFEFQLLTRWAVADIWVWGFIASLALLMVPFGPLRVAGGNFLLLFFLVYFFQGMAALADYFKKKSVPFSWQAVSWVFLLVWPFPVLGWMAVFFLGLADVWVDFRKIRNEQLKS